MSETLEQMLVRHEGVRLKPYLDTLGKITIGVGRCLDTKGITMNEAMNMLRYDIQEASDAVKKNFPWSLELNNNRFNVLVNMSFNMGIVGLSNFKHMLQAVQNKDYEEAAKQMLDSKWAKQVGARATELAEIMRKG